MILGSILGQIGHPFYVVFAQILAFCYDIVPNFAIGGPGGAGPGIVKLDVGVPGLPLP